MTSVPLSKISSIEDCCGIDFERRVFSPGIPVEPLLHRDGDELLDLLGGQAEGVGLHLDPRGRELREDVDPGVAQLQTADDEHGDRRSHERCSGIEGSR